MRILIVEDERDLNRILQKRLRAEGYEVDCCFDGQEALFCAQATNFDAVILDIMLPKLSGLDVLTQLRAEKNATPILLLTAMDSVEDRVRGLDAGADDYLIKPFSLEELLARIRTIVRKADGRISNLLTVGDLTLDLRTRQATRAGQPIRLSAKEFSILEYLMRNEGVVLSREKIENHVWNFDYTGGTNIVDVYLRYLRKKIDDGRSTKLLHTVRGSGYMIRSYE